MTDPLPLADVRVVDLTRVRSGPTAVRQLADWGAEVIKVEQPVSDAAHDVERRARDGSDQQNLHRNKRSITLDLKQDAAKAIFFRLVERADVVVENYRPGVKHRLGIDYDATRAVNPRIIYGSISGFGQSGPYRDRPGFDQVAQGMGGLMSVTGLPGQGPVRAGIPIADLASGLFLAQGILLALYERERSGQGQWVHTSLLEAQIAMLDFQAARWLIDGEIPSQAGNDHPTGIPTGVFETADGSINIAASGDAMFARLMHTIGTPELVDDSRYADGRSRSDHRETLNAAISERTRTQTSDAWIELLNAEGVPCGPINTIDKALSDPQVVELGVIKAVEHARLGRLNVVGQAVQLERTPQPEEYRLAAPDVGEHNDDVLAELGYGEQQIASLRAQGAI